MRPSLPPTQTMPVGAENARASAITAANPDTGHVSATLSKRRTWADRAHRHPRKQASLRISQWDPPMSCLLIISRAMVSRWL